MSYQPALIPAARITLAHFSLSTAIRRANFAEEPGSGSDPNSAIRDWDGGGYFHHAIA
jgi:hypothetical protein